MDSRDLHVSGGTGGTYAQLEDLHTLAISSDDLAATLAQVSVECHTILADPNLAASAILDPAGAARFIETLLGALDGRGGLTALSVGYAERAVALRVVADAYRFTDAAQAQLLDDIRWAAGYLAPAGVVVGLPLLLVAGGAAAVYFGLGGKFDYQRFITDHPGLVDDLVGASPGLVTRLTGLFEGDVPSAAHLVGQLYPDGHATVTDAGIDTSDPRATHLPNGFGDLMDGLDYRNGLAHAGSPDQIDVRVITHPDGSKAYVVDIPGTKVWDGPGSANPSLNDLGTNVHVLGGDVTAREEAIAEALRRAGASPTDPVMLVGHSQGGMVAAQAAHDSGTGGFNFNVTHVLTAGSPIGRVDIPANVQVLSLENSHDIVPHLDAAANPDRPNRTTVTFDNQLGTIGGDHSTDKSYLPAAQALDTSADPSVRAYRDSASAFLGTTNTGQTQVYDLARTP